MNKKQRIRLGNKLYLGRSDLLMTQEEVARRVRISRGFLSDIERGARSIAVDTLVRLCKTLELDMTEVVS